MIFLQSENFGFSENFFGDEVSEKRFPQKARFKEPSKNNLLQLIEPQWVSSTDTTWGTLLCQLKSACSGVTPLPGRNVGSKALLGHSTEFRAKEPRAEAIPGG
jgi:hypothetical protein